MLVTFGHSTLEPQAAVGLLDSAGVDVLVDIRSHPTSRWEWWRRQELQHWVSELTAGLIDYEWWPELGGWDTRHAQDPALVESMAAVGVDLAAYGSGSFPKQRIAKTLSAGSDPACPMHGYSSRTAPGTRLAIPADATMLQSARESVSDADSLRRPRDRTGETLTRTPDSRRSGRRSARTLDAGPQHTAPEHAGDDAQPPLVADCTPSPSVPCISDNADSDPGSVLSRIVDICSCADYTRRHPQWTNVGLRDYAWFTGLPEFRAGIDRALERFGDPAGPTCALMCAESLWWRCHRSMVADVLVARGAEAWHLQPRWTRHRDALGNRLERYPAAVRAAWGT